MARMSIDDKVLRDPRVTRLRIAMGWSRRETLGCLLDVWAVAYDRANHIASAEDIDTAAERDGFHEALVACGLGTYVPDGISMRGAEKRIAYLLKQTGHGKTGGEESGKTRRKNGKRNGDHKREGSAKPTPTVPDDLTASVSVPDTRGARRVPASPDLVSMLERWARGFTKAHGAKPSTSSCTRKAKDGLVAKAKEHGAELVMQRMDLVHETPPPWPPPPWDLQTFVTQFDRIVPRSVAFARQSVVGRVEPMKPEEYANAEPEWSKRKRHVESERPPWEDE